MHLPATSLFTVPPGFAASAADVRYRLPARRQPARKAGDMFYLHTSNRTENLLLHLAKLIEADPFASIFEKEYIVIQSQGMERMICQYMARYFTSWCNYGFLLPVNFLQEIAGRLDMEITPDCYERSFLCWRIEAHLRNIDEAVYVPLRSYLQGEQIELKRYQLARQLAHVFDQYQMMRPEMLRSWERQQYQEADESERWQMHLWMRLLAEQPAIFHRGELLHRVTAALHGTGSLSVLPKRVSVFGVHILPPFFIDYLQGLARHCDVHLFLLRPCRQYWGDLTSKRTAAGTGFHPLLISLGRQGRDFQELLLEKAEITQEFSSYEEPAGEPQTLLHRLQSDLLEGTTGTGAPIPGGCPSIRIVSCHSRRRELAVLRDHILRLLEENLQLQLDDIIVMAPDIQEYAAFIPALFEDIPHSIADRSLRRTNNHVSLFQQFLDLFAGRFGWSEVMDLLKKEEIFPHFGLGGGDFELLEHWVRQAGIRWGLSPDTRRSEGIDFVENCWKTGLERLLMGYAVDMQAEVAGVFPFTEIEGSAARPLGGLCQFIHLLEEAEKSFQQPKSLAVWVDSLQYFAALLFGDPDNSGYLELINRLRRLQEYGRFHSSPVSLQVLAAWFADSSTESRSVSGFLKGSLTFCSLLPMRSIPFRSICLLGMNYGDFPGRDRQATFDLMRKTRLGDRSVRADDRYQFLEVLLSARDFLYISYVGQSLQTNEELPPSVVVSELLEVLTNSTETEELVEKHPLHGFSSLYFSDDSNSGLFSYSERDYLICLKQKEPRRGPEPWWQGKLEAEPKPVDFNDFLRFYSHPQLYFLKNCLGVAPAENPEVPEETEVFETGGLLSYSVDQRLLDCELAGEDDQILQQRLRHDGQWPLGSPGQVIFGQKKEEVVEFAADLAALDMGRPLDDLDFEIEPAGCLLRGTLSNRFANGCLLVRYGKLRGKDLLRGWLHHLLNHRLSPEATMTVLFMKDCRVVFTADAELRPGLEEFIALYLEGRTAPSRLLLEPALEYCRQKMSPRAKIPPLVKARTVYRRSLDEGYEPSWSLVFQGADDEKVLDDDFAALCERMMLPLWRYLK